MSSARSAIFAAVALALGCSSSAPPPTADKPPTPSPTGGTPAPVSDDQPFAARADTFLAWYVENYPGAAVELGFHEQDGKLMDMAATAIDKRNKELTAALADFVGFENLSAEREYERQILVHALRGKIFETEVLRSPWRNPMSYAGALGFTDYISRDYAPQADRADAIIRACGEAATYYGNAEANLEAALPRPMIETAQLISKGMVGFLNKDVPKALGELSADKKRELAAALKLCVAALDGFSALLAKRLQGATDDFAIGEEAFLRMLADSEGVETTIEHLEKIGEADLERNLVAINGAAQAINPKKSVEANLKAVAADKPAPKDVLREAASQAEEMRRFLTEHEIVTIPSEDIAEVVATPPFLRWNFAFLSSPGAFETKALPSFYYITPPDPSWPKAVQKNYVASRSDLLFVTIHEVWPGHFLHYLHAKKSASKIARSFCSYSMSEGWAHYTEEMMWDAGVGNESPAVHIGQLKNALLRNVRFVSAIGLHTKGMTVAESKKLFLSKGYQDEASASQQATRGTFDPGYLNYTLGKLMIRKLHDDWKSAQGANYSLGGFHDAFLRYQCAPIPGIRKLMLPDDSGAAL